MEITIAYALGDDARNSDEPSIILNKLNGLSNLDELVKLYALCEFSWTNCTEFLSNHMWIEIEFIAEAETSHRV